MIYTYKQCAEKCGSKYLLKKAVNEGRLFRIEKGVYADTDQISTLAIISTKYPDAIITMDTAFYYHGLTDVIPETYYIATSKHARALQDTRIKQIYIQDEQLHAGEITMTRRDATFQIYDKERMLIELLGSRNKLPYDYYKEILRNYRDILYDLDIERIQQYAATFPKHKMISEALEREVF